ncbi:MAG: discoidin domain-containing protein, partial [Verrucomicrobiae bacterium]|nr:discoidin domain-containing protein [Verrucomicrobiae bacterium]
MKKIILAFLVVVGFVVLSPTGTTAETKPLKALLVAGGCCHDYEGQQKVLAEGIQARANVRVDVWWTDDKSTEPPLPLYDDPNWAAGYDIVIHDECAAGNKDLKVMKHILDAHQKIPAVHLHCAVHSFRNGTDQWFKHLGIQSSRHGPRKPIRIEFVDHEHPIVSPFENWTTIDEELYNNVEIYDAHPLAMGYQKVPKDGKEVEEASVVAWTNETQGARSFSTTIGHTTETVADGRYLDLVTRGLLWAVDKLNDDYLGKPYTGENTVTFVNGKPKEEKPTPPKVTLGAPPKDATLVTVTASSEETNKGNFTWRAIDGDRNTRWCAGNASKPQWLQLEFEKPQDVTGATIVWESQGTPYQHKLEGSIDGKSWQVLVDATGNQEKGDSKSNFDAKGLRFLKLTCTGTTNPGNWASVREIVLSGVSNLFPKLDEKQKAVVQESEKKDADPYTKEGNLTPAIVKLSPEKEAEILKDVTVPEGFDVTLFANSAAANYPVYVAASPNGDLYVSSDGNGSLGRDPHRGRIVRLRDTDGDGKADQVTEFVKDVDSPRGLVWDHDRLYLLHPPHITAYIDRDGDGVAEDSQRLISNIAFDFSGRPADHTTNGLELGIDGWLYIAGGDFGFMKATGTDGRTLQHRGGGVIRFRPDGSGLELFATGTRNILGTPTSPLLDIFARDNTNDGGGWDVRFHHFSGLEDHGYPRLYKNFGDEHVQPLADYGGGSGCGSVYIHEPGFPDEWKNAPFTCDWGTGALWKHTVERVGATFQEITEPQPFIKMTRPTDADVDGNSAVYQASWKGATFKWEGPDVGYIARVQPKGFQPEAMPDFDKLSDAELVAELESPSHIRTMAAQRTLLRRTWTEDQGNLLFALASNGDKALEARVAALYAISQRGIKAGREAFHGGMPKNNVMSVLFK